MPAKGYLGQGDKGTAVKQLQTLLNIAKYNCGIIDGIYGIQTTKAVKALQKASKLTVDGKFGVKTLSALKKKLK